MNPPTKLTSRPTLYNIHTTLHQRRKPHDTKEMTHKEHKDMPLTLDRILVNLFCFVLPIGFEAKGCHFATGMANAAIARQLPEAGNVRVAE